MSVLLRVSLVESRRVCSFTMVSPRPWVGSPAAASCCPPSAWSGFSGPWFQSESRSAAGASCCLPSAWSAPWWYGTQPLSPHLKHTHIHITQPGSGLGSPVRQAGQNERPNRTRLMTGTENRCRSFRFIGKREEIWACSPFDMLVVKACLVPVTSTGHLK